MLDSVIGHEKNKKCLRELGDALPSSLLFYGRSGIGKKTFAKAFVLKLLGREDHPDLRWYCLEEGQRSHKIEAIREFKEQLYLPPHQAKKKVFVIEDAQLMLPSAANALLKSLEEPPEYAIVILIASSLSELLPTIVSRCYRLPFFPLQEEEIVAFLMQKKGVDNGRAKEIAAQSLGVVSKAISLMDATYQEWVRILFDLFLKGKEWPWHQVEKMCHALEESAQKSQTSFEDVYEMLLYLLRDIALIKEKGPLAFLTFKDQETQLRIAASYMTQTLDSLECIWEKSRHSLAFHMKLKTGLEKLFIDLYFPNKSNSLLEALS